MGRAALLFALLLAAVPAPAQPPDAAGLRGESPQTRKRLSEAEAKVLGAKPADALDDLQRVLDDAADDLIGVDTKHFRAARWVAHGLAAKLRGDTLRTYQDRIDEPARKLLAAGKQYRDPRPLWTLLDRYFVSRPSEEGLMLLGELLFERGEFRAAELVWRRLLPESDVPYPSPKTDTAAVRARAILAVIFQGEHERAKGELAAFRAKHPAAKGAFAGKDGPFADTLQSLLDAPPALAEPAGRAWSSLGGGPGRSGRVPGKLPIHWPTQPTWTRLHTGMLPYSHPVIADGRAFVSANTKIQSFDLRTGREADSGLIAAGVFGPLTVAAGKVYARLGPQAANAAGETEIACFDAALKKLWGVKPPAAGEMTPAAWVGAPAVAGGRMWAVLARFEGGRAHHAMACYDPADGDSAPDRPAWVADLCDSPLSLGPEVGLRHELPTLAGRNVVFCSHAGVVVAIDAGSGRKAWAFRYPRPARRVTAAARSHDVAPAVAFGGRVFVAPADADRVYALDAETGAPLWESEPTEGARLVGVSRGRLIVTVSGSVKGLLALSVRNGSQREPDGWVQHDGGGLPTHGRGLASDDAIVWPTKAGVFFVRPDDGLPLRDPLRTSLPFPHSGLLGNVAFAEGCLVIVTASQVLGYVPDAKLFTPDDRAAADVLPVGGPGDSRPSAPNLKSGDSPSLTSDADIEATVRLPPGAHPLQPIRGAHPPKHLFSQCGVQFDRVSISGERQGPAHSDEPLTHAADLPGGVVAAGPSSVSVYGVGARPEWLFRPPDAPALSSFALAGSWLFARVGDRHLVALDLTEKRVAWVLGSHGRARYEPFVYPSCPRFEPHFFLSESILAVQLSDGRRWAVRTDTGRVLNDVGSTLHGPVPPTFGTPTAPAAWPSPPVEAGGSVAFADAAGVVRGCDPVTGRERWKRTAADEHSLTGEPPQVRSWADGVLVAIRRNHGVELDWVRPNKRSPAWEKPVFVEADRVNLAHADADPWRVYLPVGNRLTATTLSSGKLAWEVDLPETNGAGGWVVSAGRRAVVAYPEAAIPAERPLAVWDRFTRSLWAQPFVWRLPAVAAGLYDAWVARSVPVLLFDPVCGKLLKQIDVPARGPVVTAAFTADHAVVMTGDRAVWIK